MRKGFRKILAATTAMMMSVSMMMSNGLVSFAAAAGLPSGFVTDENKHMAYKDLKQRGRYNIYAYGDDNVGWISVCHETSSESTNAIKPDNFIEKKDADIYKDVTGATTVNPFEIAIKEGYPMFLDEGKSLAFKYVVTNTAPVKLDTVFSISCDTELNGNDNCVNQLIDDVLSMTAGDYSLVVFSPDSNAIIIPTELNMLNGAGSHNNTAWDPRNAQAVYEGVTDSAFLAYWPNDTFEAKTSKEYTLIVSMINSKGMEEDVRNNSIENLAEASVDDYSKNYDGIKNVDADIFNTVGSVIEIELPELPEGAVYGKIKNDNANIVIDSTNINNRKIKVECKGDLGSDPIGIVIPVNTTNTVDSYYPYDINVNLIPKTHICDYEITRNSLVPYVDNLLQAKCKICGKTVKKAIAIQNKMEYGSFMDAVVYYSTAYEFSKDDKVLVGNVEYYQKDDSNKYTIKLDNAPEKPGYYQAQFSISNINEETTVAESNRINNAKRPFEIIKRSFDDDTKIEIARTLKFNNPESAEYTGSPVGADINPPADLGEVTVLYYDKNGELVKDNENNPCEPTDIGDYTVKVTIAESEYNTAITEPREIGTFSITKKDYPENQKQVESSITNKKDSTTVIQLPMPLPEGAAFGNIEGLPAGLELVNFDKTTGEIEVKAKEDLTAEELNFRVPVAGANIYNDYKLNVVLDVKSHEHEYKYSTNQIGNVVATCENTDGECNDDPENNPIELAISSPTNTYGDTTISPATVNSGFATKTGATVSAVEYYYKDGDKAGQKVNGTGELPTDAGNYVAKVTVTDPTDADNTATASKDFVIGKKTLTEDEVKDLLDMTKPNNLKYDGESKEETVKPATGITGLGEITVKYYDEKGNEVDDTSKPGTYTVKVTIAEGDNYAAVTTPIEVDKFTVAKADTDKSKTAIGSIVGSVGSKTTVTLPELPKGASYGTVTNDPNVTVGTVADDGTVEIISKGIANAGTVTVTIPVNGGDNYNNYNITVTLSVTDHDHDFEYSVNENKEVVATCKGDGSCDQKTTPANLTVSAAEANYTGEPYSGITTNASDFILKTKIDPNNVSDVEYYKADGTKLDGAPTAAGDYIAKVVVTDPDDEDVTYVAEKPFIIAKKTLTAEEVKNLVTPTKPSNLTYNGENKEETVKPATGVTGLGGITVKYYDENGDEVTDTSKPGTYTVKVTIAEGDNYEAVTTPIEVDTFKVERGEYNGEKNASGDLAKPKNSTLEVTLPSLPEGASYGTITNDDSEISIGEISEDGKVIITSNGIANEGTKIIKIPVNGGPNYENYEVEVAVNVMKHVHAYTFSKDEDGNIVAECNGTGGSCDAIPNPLVIVSDSPEFDGQPYDEATDPTEFEETTGAKVVIEYYDSEGDILNGAPTNGGEYTKKVILTYGTEPNVQEVVSEKPFTIKPKKLNDDSTKDLVKYLDPESLIYDGNYKSATVEAADGVQGLGAITVKYYDENGNKVSNTSKVGKYTVKVDIAEGQNYGSVSDLVVGSFTVTKGEYTGTKEVEVDLPKKVNSTKEILLPALPAGATYGTPVNTNSDISVDNKVDGRNLLIASTASAQVGTITFTVPVNAEPNYQNYEVKVTVNINNHDHKYEYEVVDNVIVAKCTNDGCTKTDKKLYLDVENAEYSGEAYDGASANADEFKNATGANVTSIEYFDKATGNKLDIAPTDAGTYIAKIKIVNKEDPSKNVEIAKEFTIEPKKIISGEGESEETNIEDIIKFTPPTAPKYDGNSKPATAEPAEDVEGLGDITVKYYDENGVLVPGVPTKPGTYTVKADIAPGSNYAGATDVVIGEYTIDKGDLSVKKDFTCDVEEASSDSTTVTLPKLPEGASYGNAVIPNSDVKVTVTPDGKVVVDDNNAAPGSKIVVKIPVKGGTNYKDTEVELVVTVKGHVHRLGTKHTSVKGTCVKKGTLEWYECTGCDKKLNASGKVLSSIEGKLNPYSHRAADAVKENEVAATTTTPSSYDEAVYCKDCKKEISRKTIKGEKLPAPSKPVTPNKDSNVSVSYSTHVQNIGWQGYVKDGKMAGTTGQAKRLESIKIKVSGNKNLGIAYSTHCQTYGWLPYVKDDAKSGSEGQSKRLEGIKIKLTGADASKYDVYYRVHSETYGWLNWAKNGEPAGSEGLKKRLEGIQIIIVEKGKTFDKKLGGIVSKNEKAFINGTGKPIVSTEVPDVYYRTHVQTYDWQSWKRNGEMAGTSGQYKRMEAINIKVDNTKYSGGIMYKSHLRNIGWESAWKRDGQMSGTTGQYRRMEAIQIKLYGEMAEKFDVYYRVHSETFGWLGWAKNGELSGTAGYSKRLEGLQVILVEKGKPAPSTTFGGVTQNRPQKYIKR